MNLPYICGITFAPFAASGHFALAQAKQSLRLMKENTNANFVVLVPNGLQDTPQSEEICYTSEATMNFSENLPKKQSAATTDNSTKDIKQTYTILF